MSEIVAFLFTEPIYSNEYITQNLRKANYVHFFLYKNGKYKPLRVSYNKKSVNFLRFKDRIHYYTKEDIVTKLLLRLELLFEGQKEIKRAERSAPIEDHEVISPDDEIDEEIKDVKESIYFQDVLDRHIQAIKKEKWLTKKATLFEEHKKKFKDYVIDIPVKTVDEVYENYLYSKINYFKDSQEFYHDLVQEIILNDIVEVEGEEELFDLLPLIDNLIYYHVLKAKKFVSKFTNLKKFFLNFNVRVKYSLYDEDGNKEERYIAHRTDTLDFIDQENLNNEVFRQASGLLYDKKNQKTLLRYLQGFEWDRETDKPYFDEPKKYFSLDELHIRISAYELTRIKGLKEKDIAKNKKELSFQQLDKIRKLK